MDPSEPPHRPRHRVYLLSLWREGEAGSWRAALRPADGGPRLGFADLEQLAAYVLRLNEVDEPERAPPPLDNRTD
ncbi:MAG TPA: hypothetical protein VFI42_21060 [Thermomicrobiaceae bacterium]|nr:hypothetical protein [Thermomicrobiaceae bacterium]HET9188910.1 hypothetical protein [Acidothermaceae bacterium]